MSTYGIPLDKAELLGTVLEGILYGFSLLMFGGTIWVLFARRSARQVNRMMLAVACLLLLCSTVHMVVAIIRIIYALILYRDTYLGGPVAFLSDLSQWTFIAKVCVYAVQSFIGDSVILYRCYMAWQSKRVMILPSLTWFGSAVAGIGAATLAPQAATFSESSIRWITAFYATSFTTNTMGTILLAYRIWHVDQRTIGMRGHQKSQLRRTLHIIIDSGVIYNTTLVVVWICFSLNLNAQFVALDIIVPIISITFYLVVVRIGSSVWAHWPTTAPPRNTPTGNSLSEDGTQVLITTLITNERGSVAVTNKEDHQSRNEIKIHKGEEVLEDVCS